VNRIVSGKEEGFTLVWVIMLVVVMGTLAAAGISLGSTAGQREREQELQFRLQQIRQALSVYQTLNKSWPLSLDLLVSHHQLRSSCLRDPITRSAWVPVLEGAGVKDVHSSSQDWAFRWKDGERKRYREW